MYVNIDEMSQGEAQPAADPQPPQLWENAGQVDVNLTRNPTRLAECRRLLTTAPQTEAFSNALPADLSKRKTIGADKESLLSAGCQGLEHRGTFHCTPAEQLGCWSVLPFNGNFASLFCDVQIIIY